jgi:hypothetical protein
MAEQTVKQEGDFKIKSKKMKTLVKEDKPFKVDLSKTKQDQATEEPIKVDLSNKTTENAIQEQSTESSLLGGNDQSKESGEKAVVELQEMGERDKDPVADVRTEEDPVIQEIVEEQNIQSNTKDLENEITEAIQQSVEQNINLPENIQKVVDFMNETGGTLEDYVRLNADYSNLNEEALLREYYLKTKPYLDSEDINVLLEDFSWDEELDDEREVRKKKLAFKEEIGKAKNFLEGLKSKYYDEIKLRPGVTQEQKKAMDFFNRYNEEQKTIQQRTVDFQKRTKDYFTQDFKGFDFNLGEKKFRYGIRDESTVAETQLDLNNFVKKFLNNKGELADLSGYHKAMYVANNPDRVINHFYEQGKADAIRELTAKSKNISDDTRTAATPDLFVNGIKVRHISGGEDSSKLKIKKVKLNN